MFQFQVFGVPRKKPWMALRAPMMIIWTGAVHLIPILAASLASCGVALGQQAPCVIVDVDNAANNWFGAFSVQSKIPDHPAFGGKSFDPGRPIAPGEVVTFLVDGIETSGTSVAEGVWPASLAGMTVVVGNAAGGIFSVAPISSPYLPGVTSAITVQIPISAEPYFEGGVPYVNVSVNGQCGASLVLLPEVPVLYRDIWSGAAAVQDAITGDTNDSTHPLSYVGEFGFVAIYGYGFGQLADAVSTGQAVSGLDPILLQAKITASLDNQAIPVLYCGAAPGSVGQYVVVLQVPKNHGDAAHQFQYGEISIGNQQIGIFQIDSSGVR